MFPPKNNEFYFATIKPQFNLFLFSFLEEIEDIKGTFRNYLTFKYTLFCLMKGVFLNIGVTLISTAMKKESSFTARRSSLPKKLSNFRQVIVNLK